MLLEIARRIEPIARVGPDPDAQERSGPLWRMHDLEVLITRIRHFRAPDRAPTLKVSADLDRLVRRLETECRQLHVRYMGFKKKLLELCDYVTAADARQPASAA